MVDAFRCLPGFVTRRVTAVKQDGGQSKRGCHPARASHAEQRQTGGQDSNRANRRGVVTTNDPTEGRLPSWRDPAILVALVSSHFSGVLRK